MGERAYEVDEPPCPDGVRDFDDLAKHLRRLREWADLSIRELHRRIVVNRQQRGTPELPSVDTVHRCFQPGRRRMETDLVVDIADALLQDESRADGWRRACLVASGEASEAAIVSVQDTVPEPAGAVVGRADVLRAVADVGDHPDRPEGLVIDGMPGVGKTHLALTIGSQLSEGGTFDAVLWVDLHGYEMDRPAADPSAVLDGFLRQLGVSGKESGALPLAARSSRFRELITGRRALILLDNVSSEDQVRPLLPSSAGSVTIVTSRHRMTLPGCRSLTLDALGADEAAEMLRSQIGCDRADAEPDAVLSLIAAVGCLPLAIDLIGARIRDDPDWTLSDHLDRLEVNRRRLRLEPSIELAVAASYQRLSARARAALRGFGMHPGRAPDPYTAAALLDSSLPSAQASLDELASTRLIHAARGADHFACHDLIHLFAGQRLAEEEPQSRQLAARQRLLDLYRHDVRSAVDCFLPGDRDRLAPIAPPSTPAHRFIGPAEAMTWLDSERDRIVLTAIHAASEFPDQAADLADALFSYLVPAGHYREARSLYERVAAATQGDVRGRALGSLAQALWGQGRLDEALERTGEALEIHRKSGDLRSVARCLRISGSIKSFLGSLDTARGELEEAGRIAHYCGSRIDEMDNAGALGVCVARQGDISQALDQFRKANEIACELGHRRGESTSLANIASCYAELSRHQEAIDTFRKSIALAKELGEHPVPSYLALAETQRDVGDIPGSASTCQGARGIAETAGDALGLAAAHEGLARCAEQRGDGTRARSHRDQVTRIAHQLGMTELPPDLRPPHPDAS